MKALLSKVWHDRWFWWSLAMAVCYILGDKMTLASIWVAAATVIHVCQPQKGEAK